MPDLILEFVQEAKATGKKITTARYFKIILCFDTHEGVFPEAIPGDSIKDVYAARDLIEQAKTARGTAFKQNTVADFIRFMKRFFLWMAENGKSEIPGKEIAGHQATQLCLRY